MTLCGSKTQVLLSESNAFFPFLHKVIIYKSCGEIFILGGLHVVYMFSSFGLLAVGWLDLLQAEKEITTCKGKQFTK